MSYSESEDAQAPTQTNPAGLARRKHTLTRVRQLVKPQIVSLCEQANSFASLTSR